MSIFIQIITFIGNVMKNEDNNCVLHLKVIVRDRER